MIVGLLVFNLSRWRIFKHTCFNAVPPSLPAFCLPDPFPPSKHSLASLSKPFFVSPFRVCDAPIYLGVLSPLFCLNSKHFKIRNLILSVLWDQLHWISRLGREPALTLLNLRVSFSICKMLVSSFWALHLKRCLSDSLKCCELCSWVLQK